MFLAAFAAKQRRNVAFFASLRALRETQTGYYLATSSLKFTTAPLSLRRQVLHDQLLLNPPRAGRQQE